MAPFNSDTDPHRRLNPLTGEWVVVSPHRTQRPWQGSEAPAPPPALQFDPSCYLCPGNPRAGDAVNPEYESTFVFVNDFPALLPSRDAGGVDEQPGPHSSEGGGLFGQEPIGGECRVVCFSPRHDLTLAQMTEPEIRVVIDLLADQLDELSQKWSWVQIFETRGELCGSSNSHPHGQIWATDFLPTEAVKEEGTQAAYLQRHGRAMLLDYVEREVDAAERIVELNDHWAAVVPYWAYWPYETILLPRRPVGSLVDLDDTQRRDLAAITRALLSRYDALFNTPFPYLSGWHNCPSGAGMSSGWQLHAHYYPPLLRSATVAKVPASYEWLASYQRDLTAERAAENLRRAFD